MQRSKLSSFAFLCYLPRILISYCELHVSPSYIIYMLKFWPAVFVNMTSFGSGSFKLAITVKWDHRGLSLHVKYCIDLMLDCQFKSQLLHFQSSFLHMHLEMQQMTGPTLAALAAHTGDFDGLPGFCPQPGSVPGVTGIWWGNPRMDDLSQSLSVSVCVFFIVFHSLSAMLPFG